METRPGYTIMDEIGCLLNAADETNPKRSLTYPECADELETALQGFFPSIDQDKDFFPILVDPQNGLPYRIDPQTQDPVSAKEYCLRLVGLARQFDQQYRSQERVNSSTLP